MNRPFELLTFPHKKIRAQIIKKYLEDTDYIGVVCFSCGNAARELKNAGLNVLEISVNGDLSPLKWFSQKETNSIFTNRFNATAGELPFEVMNLLARAYRKHLGDLGDKNIYVPTGSGETIVALKMAYPEKGFIAVYNLNDATAWNANAPYNAMVRAITEEIIFADEENSQ